MNHVTARIGDSRRQSFTAAIWILLGVFLVTYGFVAFNAGSKLSPALNTDSERNAATVGYILDQAEHGASMTGEPETSVLPFWINLMARLGSEEYAYGPDGIMETEQGYHAMEPTRRYVLSTHMMLGLIIMAAGFFQFWPSFRRKHRVAHRRLGVVYILAALASMSMSAYFLTKTGINGTFNGFVFFTGLWFLLILSLLSIGIAMWAISRRKIAVHLGWQALAFSCFLSAPIQRALWVGMAPLADGASFNEMNIAVNVSLFAWCFLLGYGLFYANRESAEPRAKIPSAAMDLPKMTRVILGVWVIGAWLQAVGFYLVSGGFGGSGFAQRLSPTAAAAWHDAVVGPLFPWVLIVSLAVFLSIALRWLLLAAPSSKLSPRAATALGVTGVLVAGLYLRWGFALGMPDHERSVAGVFYLALGVVLLFFLGLFAYGHRRDEIAKAREWLWFAVPLSVGPGLMYGQLFLLDLMGIIPDDWLHHGYQLAAAIGLSTPVLVGHLLAVYSKLTATRSVR